MRFCRLQVLVLTDAGKRLDFCMLTDCTGIDQNTVRSCRILRNLITEQNQRSAETLTVCFILMTAEGTDIS